MKEMIYKEHEGFCVLNTEIVDDIPTFIVSRGTHPCAYIDISSLQNRLTEAEIDSIDVHGGITWIDSFIPSRRGDKFKYNGFIIGWDYAHAGDWHGCYSEEGNIESNRKKWTTAEIFEDIKSAVRQLKEMDRRINPLKPCPFCGGAAIIRSFSGECGATCTNCNATIIPDKKSTRDEVARYWNRRVDEKTIVDANIYDKREIHHNCTVEILENSVTGKVSIGWYKEKECEE